VRKDALARRIAVVGASGRLGRFLSKELESAGHNVLRLGRADLDVTDAKAITRTVTDANPHVVVNCTAYNAVDAAEGDATSAFAVNGHAPGVLAAATESVGAVFIHFGTDFVFDGATPAPYSEEDATKPLSVYGSTKLAGETEVRRFTSRHYIFRVASLFGGVGAHGHRATIDYITETLITRGTVRALTDRTVSPSYVPDVSRAVSKAIETQIPFGTYHCVSTGFTTWYHLAEFVARELNLQTTIEPLQVHGLKSIAARPQYCALSNEKLRSAGIDMPDWQSAVSSHIRQRVDSVVTL